jgi:hypothetical protein
MDARGRSAASPSVLEPRRDAPSYAGFWVTRRSGGVVCRHVDDLNEIETSGSHLHQVDEPVGPSTITSRYWPWLTRTAALRNKSGFQQAGGGDMADRENSPAYAALKAIRQARAQRDRGRAVAPAMVSQSRDDFDLYERPNSVGDLISAWPASMSVTRAPPTSPSRLIFPLETRAQAASPLNAVSCLKNHS